MNVYGRATAHLKDDGAVLGLDPYPLPATDEYVITGVELRELHDLTVRQRRELLALQIEVAIRSSTNEEAVRIIKDAQKNLAKWKTIAHNLYWALDDLRDWCGNYLDPDNYDEDDPLPSRDQYSALAAYREQAGL